LVFAASLLDVQHKKGIV